MHGATLKIICYVVTEEMMWALSKHAADQLCLTQVPCKTSLVTTKNTMRNLYFTLLRILLWYLDSILLAN